jgi:AAT family amino acid transporter/D-serine/D-alanine/glycine transporter
LNYLVPDQIFGYLMGAVAALLMWTWSVIMLCHLAYRRRVARGEAPEVGFRLPLSPYSNWLVLLFFATVAVLLALNGSSRTAYYTAACWFGILLIAEAIVARRACR